MKKLIWIIILIVIVVAALLLYNNHKQGIPDNIQGIKAGASNFMSTGEQKMQEVTQSIKNKASNITNSRSNSSDNSAAQ